MTTPHDRPDGAPTCRTTPWWTTPATNGSSPITRGWADTRYAPAGISLLDLYATDAEQRLDRALNLRQ